MANMSVVVLTMGDRAEALRTSTDSVRAQSDVDAEIVLVVNGGSVDHTLADVIIEPKTNLGIPGGRNAGAAAASGDLIFFLDDDAHLIDPHTLSIAAERFVRSPNLAALGLGIVDEFGQTTRRHVPRIGNANAPGPATSFPGGACIIRRSAFEEVGGLCAEFEYGLEETDLAWRLLDAGWQIDFDPSLRLQHPRTDPNRHELFLRRTARNRVYVAHRSLPLPFAAAYLFNWLVITAFRHRRRPAEVRTYLGGTREGWRTRVGPRKPISGRTIWHLTRLGRPPVI